jgi:tRNA(Ile)-lysidine synthetase-like protein
MSYPQYLLEFPKDYLFGSETFLSSPEHPLKKVMSDFIKPYKNIILSLSGGVDSMVCFALLSLVKEDRNLTTASINYNLRDESSDELYFIKDYTKKYEKDLNINYSITLEISRKKEDSVPRSEFEETSRELRFNLYLDIIKENKWSIDETIIIVGHHQDDLIENVFNNFMQGRDLTDLTVMREKSLIHGLTIGRPLLSFPKSDIYDFSHKYQIPYFKNTTPIWSKRGQMREILFPLLEKIYGEQWKTKILSQGLVSDSLEELVSNKVKIDYQEKNEDKSKIISFNKRQVLDWNQYLWSKKLAEILHSNGEKMVSQKAIKLFLSDLNKNKLINRKFNEKVHYQISEDKFFIKLLAFSKRVS